jgi:hypothetical protein
MEKHRISTNIGRDQIINLELKQEYDLLEILSLRFTQKEVYTSLCADYGVVCGRIIINNGLGVPNAKVSIFIPLSDEDESDPVISKLYPYKTVSDKNEENYRYNLLPTKKQHGGHEPTGTFPDQTEIVNREEVLEVYEKYYKYTVKTNSAGDFMIWGVPIGEQTIHVDIDLSDIGCFSFQPYDLMSLGIGRGQFKNEYTFKTSEDLDSLPQVISFNKTIEVYPFWGNEDLCEISITRTDFDLSEKGVRIEPKAYFIGGSYTDNGKNSINKNCQPRKKMGRKCDLVTQSGTIESIRFTNRIDENGRPILEEYELDGEIDFDGSFFMELPMNAEFLSTNEFGENEISDDNSKGVPTAAMYRLRMSLNDSGLDRTRTTGNYIVPNIREYDDEKDKSYAFSLNWDDYPTGSTSFNVETISDRGIFYRENNGYYPRDNFFRFSYNKVYTVSSFQSSYFRGGSFNNDSFVGIKELVPTEEEDCGSDVLTPPVNFGVRNNTFQLLLAEVFLFFEQILNLTVLTFFNTMVRVLHTLASVMNFWPIRKLSKIIKGFAYIVQESGQRGLYLINYPECEECRGNNEYGTPLSEEIINYCQVGSLTIVGNESSVQPRTLSVNVGNFNTPNIGDCLANANKINNMFDFINRQTQYVITFKVNPEDIEDTFIYLIEPGNFQYNGFSFIFNDKTGIFNEVRTYIVTIRDNTATSTPPLNDDLIEEGCAIYDTPYDEGIVKHYYTGDTENRTEVLPQDYVNGMDVVATQIGGDDGKFELKSNFNGRKYKVITPSGYSEFKDGVFSIIPGSQSNIRLWEILREYRRRKRVGTLFCGGVVNYSYIDNWLSGSVYFFQFKSKSKNNGDRQKYCDDVVHYVREQDKFYYRSSPFDGENFGSFITQTQKKRIGRPTTIVDLGPRDEFLKQICIDPSLDPNCSIVRSIGPTSYQNFGEILGMTINYRMDLGNNEFDIKDFFDNEGNTFNNRVLDGDILQLISINSETGIEEFDLQSPKYLGYTYQLLDPELNPDLYKNGGPTPINMELSEDGERIRLCLNEPGRLTESSQKVPFFLWDKGGTGFGQPSSPDNQFWDYTNDGIQVQPLQGMTYNYSFVGGQNDSSDQYLLLPMTQNYTGQTFSSDTVGTDEIPFDIVSLSDVHENYNTRYQGFTVLYVTVGTILAPTDGILYTRVGNVSGTTTNDIIITNGWHVQVWNSTMDFIIKPTIVNYNGNKQILSTPFQFYFGLRPGKTGLDKFIKLFGPNRPIVEE